MMWGMDWACCTGQPAIEEGEMDVRGTDSLPFGLPTLLDAGLRRPVDGLAKDAFALGDGLAGSEATTAATADEPHLRSVLTGVSSLAEMGSDDCTCTEVSFCTVTAPDPGYTEAEVEILRNAKKRWTQRQNATDRRRRAEEYASMLQQTRAQMAAGPLTGDSLPANRYGSDARLSDFVPGKHVPVLALINPHSGAMAGSDILALARKTPYYKDTFFNIIDVVKDQRRGGLLDVFRFELNRAKDQARAIGTRARIISAGGDGTASFALFMIFAALRADEKREEEGLGDAGNGFIWNDEDMRDCFPAIAQMPLGSANDFGHTLGWGQKYPGDAESSGMLGSRARALGALQTWIEAVIDPASRIANFDLFGFMPMEGQEECDFKLAELTGRRGLDPKVLQDGKAQLLLKEASTPVPLFCCLYFSTGFAAYMTARFQLNRKRSPAQNKMEYVRQALGIMSETVPPQLLPGLEGVEVSCGGESYFPPRKEEGNCGSKYREVGFLNINWQGATMNGHERSSLGKRLLRKGEPSKFNDGKMAMYRLKFKSALKNPGVKLQTDKKDGDLTMTYSGGKGQGVFFQWDGEARFAFSPAGKPFHINIQKIMNIPVVLGPGYDSKVTGNPDNGRAVTFAFAGATLEQQKSAQQRVLRGVRGELTTELNATREEILAAGLLCEAEH